MRIVIHNPHCETHFGTTVFNFITRRYSHKKYSFLLKLLKKPDCRIIFYIDFNDSSFPQKIRNKILILFEFALWLIINHIPLWEIGVITNHELIQNSDIFFSFTFRNLDKDDHKLEFLATKNICSIFHLTHYMIDTWSIAKNTKALGIKYFVAENNLAKNSSFFIKYFPLQKNVYTLPFVFHPRFKRYVSFTSRKYKCVAIGTLYFLRGNDAERFKDIIAYYNTDTIHPGRKMIYQNKDSLEGMIDCYISNFREREPQYSDKNNSIFLQLYKKLYNAFMVKQKNYFKFNIVKEYNEHSMFIVPEEINSLPGISFIEGMACGAAYIGLRDPMYSDIGLQEGVHYIAYDGSLEDLVCKISYYKENWDECEKIANTGYEFVRSHFNATTVLNLFYYDLLRLCEAIKMKDMQTSFFSSFIENPNE